MTKQVKYKDTGLEWCPQIPEHWEMKKLKYLGEAIIGITYSPEEVIEEGKGILVLRASNIQNNKLTFFDNVFVNKKIDNKYITKTGDILVCARNGSAHLVGKSALISSKNESLTFGAFMLIYRSDIGEFIFNIFNSNLFRCQTGLFKTVTINQLTSGTINNMFVPIPPFSEQQKISDYLDEKTSLIDSIIARKEKQIALYKEERTAVINQAVTKGLNPNVKMKDSGIEWLGEIPEHWEVKKLKYILQLRNEIVEKIDFVIAVENIESATGRLVKMDEEKIYIGSLSRFYKNDILFNKLRPYLHKVYFAEKEGGVHGELLILETLDGISPRLMYYVLFNKSFIDIVDGSTQGSKMPRANWEGFINQISVLYPTFLEEQQQIVSYLDQETERIDTLVEKTTQQINLLKEYKEALINEVVTGQRIVE